MLVYQALFWLTISSSTFFGHLEDSIASPSNLPSGFEYLADQIHKELFTRSIRIRFDIMGNSIKMSLSSTSYLPSSFSLASHRQVEIPKTAFNPTSSFFFHRRLASTQFLIPAPSPTASPLPLSLQLPTQLNSSPPPQLPPISQTPV